MRITAALRNLRIAPRKVRRVADAIRGKRASVALRILTSLPQRPARPLLKLVHSAVANANHNFRVTDPAGLVVAEIRVDGGATLKRIRPRAMGRAFPIRKHTSHISLVLETTLPVKARPVKEKPNIAVVPESDAGAEVEVARKAELPRGDERQHPKAATKSTGFVRRMFRRKAI